MSVQIDKPWLIDAFEILEFGLISLFIDNKAYRRFTLIALDNAVEIAMWNFLKFEKSQKPPENDFNKLCKKVKASSPAKDDKEDFFKRISYYHVQRNLIYHQGTAITDIQNTHLIKQCLMVIELFEFLFYEDYEAFIVQDKKMGPINSYLRLKGRLNEIEVDKEVALQVEEVEDKIQSIEINLPFTNWVADDLQDTTDTINEIYNSL